MDNLLEHIEDPADLRLLKIEELPQVCKELRDFIIDESSRNPGHFGASLGTVELTVALHYAFNTPEDRIIWDVGHQAYGHKILTNRKKAFATNRKFGTNNAGNLQAIRAVCRRYEIEPKPMVQHAQLRCAAHKQGNGKEH